MNTVLGVEASLTGRRWVWRPSEERIGLGIAQLLGVPELLGRLLAARGVDAEGAAVFLEPTLRALLPDPAALTDMPAAAVRLADAVERSETIGVFGDYDVDGACSGALMVGLLRRLGCTVHFHVPDRMKEGYGPNGPALLGLAARGARLILCVDCGTSAHDAIEAVRDIADVVIFDHHKAEGAPPPVVAMVNPNRLDDRSGLGTLCAAAVSFLGAVALVRELRRRGAFASLPEPDLMRELDLVALATICDVMPLTGLNRALVTQGLKVMAVRARPGLAALLEVAQLRDPPSAMHCGFALGPRINAAGRIAEADMGLRLLLAEETVEAAALARELDAVNKQRQQVEGAILNTALARAEMQAQAGHKAICLADEAWHPGVVGIIAGRLKEKFNRPVCVAAVIDGMAKGSGRSIAGLDLGAAVIAARQAGLLTTGGGHAMAAGFSLPAGAVQEFHAFLDARFANAPDPQAVAPLTLEGSLAVAGATSELAHLVAKLGPFGQGNDEPLFVLPRVRVAKADRIGKDGNTIRAMLEGEGGGRLKALLFRAGDSALAAALSAPGAPLHLAGYLRAESWNGMTSAGFFVADAAPV